MADPILDKVPIDPFSVEASSNLDKQFKVDNLRKKVNKRSKRLRESIAAQPGFNQTFNRLLQRRKPVEKELERSFSTINELETDPFTKRQLRRSAETAAQQRRQNIAGDFGNILQARISAQAQGVQTAKERLAEGLTDRNAARSFLGQQFFDSLNARRAREAEERQNQFQIDFLGEQTKAALDQYRKRLDIDKSLGINAFAPRGGGGGRGPSLQFKELEDGTFGAFNPATGEFVPMGQALTPEAQSAMNTAVGQTNTFNAITDMVGSTGRFTADPFTSVPDSFFQNALSSQASSSGSSGSSSSSSRSKL